MSRDTRGKKSLASKKGKVNTREKKTYEKRDEDAPSAKPFNKRSEFKPSRTENKKEGNKPAFERFRDDSKPSDFGTPKKRSFSDYGDARKEKSYKGKSDDNRADFGAPKKRSFSDYDDSRKEKSYKGKSDDKPFSRKKYSDDKPGGFDKKEKTFQPKITNPNDLDESDFEYDKPKSFVTPKKGSYIKKPYVKKTYSGKKPAVSNPQRKEDDGLIRLNKYIANAGISSRREADDLISSGVVQVNGKTITEMGYRVKPTDIVKYGGQTLKKERMVYFILNKPKDYITTSDDPQKRRTVFELMKGTGKERIYPVGRLDRATTGLLMFTNDGELTKKLTHPKYGVRKIYHVELDKPLKIQDLEKIREGLELEDGEIKVDEVTFVGDGKDKTQIGVELHSGKNRIVRRIFESLGYNVRKLDRVMFGSITKKDLPRGRWRLLTEAEVGMLKMISAD